MRIRYIPLLLLLSFSLAGASACSRSPCGSAALTTGSIPLVQAGAGGAPAYKKIDPNAKTPRKVTKQTRKRRRVARKPVARARAAAPKKTAAPAVKRPAIPLPVTQTQEPIPPLTPDQGNRYRLDPFGGAPDVPPRLQ